MSVGQRVDVYDPGRRQRRVEHYAAVEFEGCAVEIRMRQPVAPGGEEFAYKIGCFTACQAFVDGEKPIGGVQREFTGDGETK